MTLPLEGSTSRFYGPGCKRCERTEQMIRDAATRLGVAVEVEKVTDARAIAMAGVMSTPGIAVDGRLVHSGALPDRNRLEGWLTA
jgi:small redox-active disulfide protein 2